MKYFNGLLFCLVFVLQLKAQENFPVNGVKSSYNAVHAFINAQIHLDAEAVTKRGVLLVKDQEIVSVGLGVNIPENAIIHNLEGAHIYPSFIDPYTNYGLPEVTEAKWNPRPQLTSNTPGFYSWNQSLKPEFHASEAFVSNRAGAKEMIECGFGAVLTYQNDGIIRGSSALVSLGNTQTRSALIKPKVTANYSFNKGSSTQDYPSSFMGSIALLRQSIYDAIWANHNKDLSNLSLVALHNNLKLKPIIEVDNHLSIRNVLDIGNEFKMNFIIKGDGDEYLSLKQFINSETQFILPLNFPEPYDVSDPYDCLDLSLEKMKHWELAPANPSLLAAAGFTFAFTSHNLKSKKDFLKQLRKAVEFGLAKETALRALTTVPAKMLGVEKSYGLLKKGMKANFLIFDKELFDPDSRLLENWVHGEKFVVNETLAHDYRGSYILKIDGAIFPLEIGGTKQNLKTTLISEDTLKVSFKVENQLVHISYKNTEDELVRLSGQGIDPIEGEGQLANGDWVSFVLKRKGAFVENKVKDLDKSAALINLDKVKLFNDMGEQWWPNMSYGWTEKPNQKAVLFKNVTLWTNEQEGVIENASLAIYEGKIIAVGNKQVDEIKNKYAFEIIDGVGMHLTSGIIDEHSHIALRSVNESAQVSSAEVRMSDALRPNDVNIYRQLAGGVTSAQLLHGSANPIGGQSVLIKMRWGSSAQDMIFSEAKPFVKFALGENVKQSNWGSYARVRFPQTRMGVEQVYYDYFTRARVYEKEWNAWFRLSAGDKKQGKMPHKDLDLECILEILNDQREITCHSYRQSEINMLMQVADSMNFTLNTFTHILEGYKVAEKMKAHGAGASTFSDWWAYKYEVNDAIPHNGSLLNDMGIVTAFNSDDAEMARRLNQEAGKAVKYGNTSEEDAWKFVTLNPAKLLHIEHKVGSLKTGKDADLVLWSGHPMSIYSKVEQTYVDGCLYYSLSIDRENRERNEAERNRLIQKMLGEKSSGSSNQKVTKDRSYHFHCDD
ncbi:amidohydrolase family protein [Flavobacteriales bacterium]|nr:amidohydrolase family protein [Flavobacteriales bacterium]